MGPTPIQQLYQATNNNPISFGVLAKISDKDLEEAKDNENLYSEVRAMVNYEIKTRAIQLPEDWKL